MIYLLLNKTMFGWQTRIVVHSSYYLVLQYSSDKPKTPVETAIYRVSKTQNSCQ
ncbi:hypothetical protein [Nostoc sp. DSM 114159]